MNMAPLLHGTCLRVNECATLRVQDIDLHNCTITVRNTQRLSGPSGRCVWTLT